MSGEPNNRLERSRGHVCGDSERESKSGISQLRWPVMQPRRSTLSLGVVIHVGAPAETLVPR